MSKIFLITAFIFISNFCFTQEDGVAIETSKEVLELIKKRDYSQFLNSFEDTVITNIKAHQKRVGPNYIQETVDRLDETLAKSKVDFKKFNKKFLAPIEGKVRLNRVIYQFPIGTEKDGKDYFETSFIAEKDFKKIFSVDVVKIQRMPKVSVTYGAENEAIPEPGEVITENHDETGFIKKVKYRDFTHLITIEFDQQQNKTRETRFPLDNLKYKSITAYHKNGNIRLVANYDNGIVTGNFTKFHENGKISENGFYKSGLKKDGIWTYFDDTGEITKKEIYEQGELVQTE